MSWPAKPASCRFLSSMAPTVCGVGVAPTNTIARGLKILSRLRTDMTRECLAQTFQFGCRASQQGRARGGRARRSAGRARLNGRSRLEDQGAVEIKRVVLAGVAAGSVEIVRAA